MSGRQFSVSATVVMGLYLFSPNMNVSHGSRTLTDKSATLRAIQTINTAQVQYNSQFGRYARSLAELGPSAANLIPADVASGRNRGYGFAVTKTPAGDAIHADPVTYGTTGTHTFYSDQSLRIRESYGKEPATADSREVGAARRP